MKRMNTILTILLFLITNHIIFSQSELSSKQILQQDKSLGRTAEVLENTLIVRFKQGYSHNYQSSLFAPTSPIRLISPVLHQNMKIQSNKQRIKTLSQDRINKIMNAQEPLLRTYIVEYFDNEPPEMFAKKLMMTNPAIEIAEPYYVNKTQNKPNDARISDQRMLEVIKAFDGWEISKGSPDIVIAISDNGIDQTHPDLIDNLAINENEIPDNGIDDDDNGYIDDHSGYNFTYESDGTSASFTRHNDSHGVEVAGIAGATTNNIIGIAGVGYNCRIFPIKTAFASGRSIVFGYQSIIYAAVRGFNVINCSWGAVKPFSEIEQSIIDFAVANDLVVVAAGGNLDYQSGADRYSSYYPAGYRGVLGVGETDQSDNIVYSNSVLGTPVRIVAPGQGNISLNNSHGYQTLSMGSSYSAPVVAGVLGIVRYHFPELTARQAIEWVRIRTDDITPKNFTDRDIIPGRVNLYKALTGNPTSQPALSLESYSFRDGNNEISERFTKDDTISVYLNLKNHLEAGNNFRFVLSVAYSLFGDLVIVDSILTKSEILPQEEFVLAPFRFVMPIVNKEKIMFRIDITDDSGYRDFIKFDFYSGSEVTTLSNEVLKFSVSDAGTIGYTNDRKQGIGFSVENIGNHLYQAGLMTTANDLIAFNTIYGGAFASNDFRTIKPYTNPNKNTGIVSATKTITQPIQETISTEVTTVYTFPFPDKPVVKTKLTLRNVGNSTITNPAVGYLFDWDLSKEPSTNNVGVFPEAIPPKFQSKTNAAAEFAASEHNSFYAASIAFSDNDNHIAQAAGLDMGVITNIGFSQHQQITSLNSGISKQIEDYTDVGYVIGMNFRGLLLPGESRVCYICIAMTDDKNYLAKILRECADSTLVSVAEIKDVQIQVFPNPANDFVNVAFPNFNNQLIRIILTNITGMKLASFETNSNKLYIPLQTLNSGIYYISINYSDRTIFNKISVVR